MKSPSEKYLEARERALKSGHKVPSGLLEAHCNYMRQVKRMQTGLHPMVITITRNTTQFVLDLFPRTDRTDIIIRVEGEQFGENRI